MLSARLGTAIGRSVKAFAIIAGLALGSGCDDRAAAPRPDRDTLYRLFERAADFATALDRLDIVCGSTGLDSRVDWVLRKSAAVLEPDQQTKLDAFIEDHRRAVFDTYKGKYCGMEVSTERDNYVAAYTVHRVRLESAIAKVKG